ncbi:MAG: hypothetical protein QXF12_00745 [Candidatus Aenigmatarchaeota archaeon]
MNSVDVKRLKSKGFNDNDISFVDSICKEYELDINDLHLHKENNVIYYSLDYRFFISLAIKNGLKSVVVTQDDNFINIKLEREGFNSFEYSLDKRTIQKGNVSSIMLNKTAISNALKILFADVFAKYNHFGMLPRRSNKDVNDKFNKDYKNTSYEKNNKYDNKQYYNKNNQSKTDISKDNNADEINNIRKKIMELQNIYNLDKDTFYSIVEDAKSNLFESNKKLETVSDYNILYNYLKNVMEVELGSGV